MIQPIQALTPPVAPPIANAGLSAQPSNVTINQSNVAFIAGNVGSLTLANVVDLQNMPEGANITINQSNMVILASQAYSKAGAAKDAIDTLIDEMLAQLVTGVAPNHDKVVLPVSQPALDMMA